jgi:hypothetical protein
VNFDTTTHYSGNFTFMGDDEMKVKPGSPAITTKGIRVAARSQRPWRSQGSVNRACFTSSWYWRRCQSRTAELLHFFRSSIFCGAISS